MSVVKPVPLNRLRPGTVVWAHVPFADGTGEKARPAVVVKTRGRDIELFPGTTSTRRFDMRHCHVELSDLNAAGLTQPTGVRLTSVTVDRIELICISGSLGIDDAADLGIESAHGVLFGHDAA